MIKPILKLGNPKLRLVSSKIALDQIGSNWLKELMIDMEDTMNHLGGIGIAAPQIAENYQICLIHLKENNPRYQLANFKSQKIWIINPEITITNESLQGFWEGCLSLPGLRGYVERPSQVEVSFWDENSIKRVMKLDGFLATVFQHELDHLFGKLYIDHVTDKSLIAFEEEYQKYILGAPQVNNQID